MRFAQGATRWVILTDRYAIKIAQFHPLQTIIRFIQHVRAKEVGQRVIAYAANPLPGVMKYVFAGMTIAMAGMIANRTEHRLYKKYGDDNFRIAPTIFSFFWLVNVQLRGAPVNEEELPGHPLWCMFQDNDRLADCRSACQYCRLGGKIHLADYGRPDLEPVFLSYQKRLLLGHV